MSRDEYCDACVSRGDDATDSEHTSDDVGDDIVVVIQRQYEDTKFES